ncbi:hypothetical protein HT102_02730 [Hoyosella sp. G463]|uniref:ABC transporter permease n=1 Tax=Lolliginicoccus lacisalsi TaxID=2742202 RepID=A0A927JA13_9ACTN|nr:hypothetical protein [Lolliginicoccus lacisalsi]MBD8505404.1 hypothetical protein [Lolliginicoccus lacisalsi]
MTVTESPRKHLRVQPYRTVWRQHRRGVLAVILAFIVLLAIAAASQYTWNHAFWGAGGQSDRLASIANLINILVRQGSLLLPVLLGMLLGAGLISRARDTGRHVLAFTQDSTRWQWYLAHLLVVHMPVAAAAAVYAPLVQRFDAPAPMPWQGRFSLEHFLATPLIAGLSMLAALQVGALIALLLRNPLAAMPVTLVVLLAAGSFITLQLRPHYATPEVTIMAVEEGVLGGYGAAYATNEARLPWMLERVHVTADGRTVDHTGEHCPWPSRPWDYPEMQPGDTQETFDARVEEIERQQAQQFDEDALVVAQCLRDRGADHFEERFHPDSRFWLFQATEAALLLLITGLALAVARWRIGRID